MGETSAEVDGVLVRALVLKDLELPHKYACGLLEGLSFREAIKAVGVKNYGIFIPLLIDGFQPYSPPPRIKKILIGSIPEEPVQLDHAMEVFLQDPLWC
jgi:hypothetical protein